MGQGIVSVVPGRVATKILATRKVQPTLPAWVNAVTVALQEGINLLLRQRTLTNAQERGSR